jgi:acetyl-CoA carboxylase carboxyl transferase subunit beta
LVYRPRLDRHLSVCPDCGHHVRLGAVERAGQLLDAGWSVVPAPLPADDPLGFADTVRYAERLRAARERTGLDESVLVVRGAIEGHPVVAAIMDFRFLGGSLGTGAGERVTAAAELALAERCPLLAVTASGGARMQEGILSLLQMAKTSQAFADLDAAGLLTVSVVTDPTYAGVAASFATLADVVVAEPGARMGFTGPRVIQQVTGQTLPPGFQTAELLLTLGLVDDVQPRERLRDLLADLLAVVARPAGNARPDGPAPAAPADATVKRLPRSPDPLPSRDPWQTVRLARHPGRPTTLDHLGHLVDGFRELHGDRASGDCPAVVGGLGRLRGIPVVAIGHQKGHSTAELVARSHGMPSPAGQRKAARLLRLAAKLRLPVVTLVDTPGADPGVRAEEQGQAHAIAANLRLLSRLPVPVVAAITGEGGSGGALALAVADRVLCYANAVYSVISPEGCASILWRTPAEAPRAAAALALDAAALLRLGVVDAVVPEPPEGAHRDPQRATASLGDALSAALRELCALSTDDLLLARRRRLRAVGQAGAGTLGVPA